MATILGANLQPGTIVRLVAETAGYPVGTQAYLLGYENAVDTNTLHAMIRVPDDKLGHFDLRVTPAKYEAVPK